MESTIPACAVLAASIVMHPLANPDVLEPSVRNEVDHALSLVTNAPALALDERAVAFVAFHATNGMNATERAIGLVSSQRDGRWRWQGADVTPVAAWILRRAAGLADEPADTNVVPVVRRAMRRLRGETDARGHQEERQRQGQP